METTYPSGCGTQGQALVFVNDTFDAGTEMEDRGGAEHDITHFTQAFEKCGLSVVVMKNTTLQDTLKTIVQFARDKKRFTENMMVVAFSTHGTQMELRTSGADHVAADALYCTDKVVRVSTITKFFTEANCPGMAGKPKLFFLQACRGTKYDETLEGSAEKGWEPNTMSFLTPDIRPVVEVPIFRDFLLAYSAPPGYLSFRSPTSGSWFVRCLHDVIMTHGADLDLVSLLTLVKNKVALSEEFMVKRPDPQYPYEKNRKIVPWTVSMLTKEVRLMPPSKG